MKTAFKRSDADKLEMLVRIVGKWRMKAGLTIPEVLTALRYDSNKGEFEDYCATAEHSYQGYRGYKDLPDEDDAQ